jgi:hypothetical protein
MRPVLFDALGGGVRDRRDGRASLGEEHESRPPVVRIRATLDVSRALELIDGLGHRLLPHAGELGKLRNGAAVRAYEGEHVRGRGANVVEARLAQRGVDRLGVLLVDQPQQQPDQRAGGEVGVRPRGLAVCFERFALRFQD